MFRDRRILPPSPIRAALLLCCGCSSPIDQLEHGLQFQPEPMWRPCKGKEAVHSRDQICCGRVEQRIDLSCPGLGRGHGSVETIEERPSLLWCRIAFVHAFCRMGCPGFDQACCVLPCLPHRWVLYGFQLEEETPNKAQASGSPGRCVSSWRRL